jgi:glycosyltransferase involved in cell wall biosynthesis
MPDRGLLVCSTLPLPPISGGRKRSLRLLEAMERARIRPHVLAVDGSDEALAAMRARGWPTELHPWPPQRAARRIGQYARMEPHPRHAPLAARMRELAAGAAFVELEEIERVQLIRDVPREVPTIVSLYNVDSAVTRHLAREQRAWSPDAARLHLRALRMATVERRAARRATATLCASAPDLHAFRSAGAREAILVENGIDDELFAVPGGEVADEIVLFFGAFFWAPNRDGLVRFLREGWPAVRARRPRARLRVVGPGPLDAVRRAADGRPGVELVGVVDDLTVELAAARLSVVPLWVGGGTRIKVLESMAAARPVVGTPVGVEHLAFRAGRHGLVADDPAGLAAATVALLADPTRAAALGRQAREDARDRRWTATTQPAEALYRALREGRRRA